MCDPSELPSYIPAEWADRIQIATDERGTHYLWTGWNNGQGHGKVRIDGHICYTHWVVVETVMGIKLGRFDYVDHGCAHKPCLNFDHLEPVTPKVNTERGPGRLHQFKPRMAYAAAS